MHDLRERWNRLWEALGAAGSPDSTFVTLAAAYDDPQRSYHNLAHIEMCLDELDRAEYLAERPRDIEYAIWFHDVVYDTHRSDNEARSADLALSVIESATMKRITAAAVKDLIHATQHNSAPSTNDGRLIADIDLAILGQKTTVFDAYETAIRKEFAWIDEETFRAERSKVMRHFLEQPHVYHTAMYRGRFETAARSNLQRSIERLKRQA